MVSTEQAPLFTRGTVFKGCELKLPDNEK